jgi:hypothetical protein
MRIPCNANISIGHLPISQSDIDLLLSQLDILQYLKQTLCLYCLNWTYSNISSRPEPSAISTGHPPVSQANLAPLLSQLAIFQYLKQTVYLYCLNWTSSSVSSRLCTSTVSTRHPPVSQANLTSLSRAPRLASAPHASCMLSAYFRTHFLLSDDTLLLWLSLLLIGVSPVSLLRRICSSANLSSLATYARSSYIPDKVPEPSDSFIALITRFGGIAHARRYRLEGRIKITSDRFEHPRPLRLELAQLSEGLRGSCVA